MNIKQSITLGLVVLSSTPLVELSPFNPQLWGWMETTGSSNIVLSWVWTMEWGSAFCGISDMGRTTSWSLPPTATPLPESPGSDVQSDSDTSRTSASYLDAHLSRTHQCCWAPSVQSDPPHNHQPAASPQTLLVQTKGPGGLWTAVAGGLWTEDSCSSLSGRKFTGSNTLLWTTFTLSVQMSWSDTRWCQGSQPQLHTGKLPTCQLPSSFLFHLC